MRVQTDPMRRAANTALFKTAGLFLLALAVAGLQTPPVRAAAQPPKLYYHIFVRSFRDSNGDRIGDLDGVRQKLSYIKSLHATDILLTPVQTSPFYHNYFSTDFYGVDPAYGGSQAMTRLIRAAHARGLRIILDEEFQYVAEGHPWWAQTQDRPGAPEGEFILYNDPAHNRDPEPFLTAPRYRTAAGRDVGIAMVNLASPRVRDYFSALLRRGLDPHGDGSLRDGVDGYRIDHMMDDLDGKHRLTGLFKTFWAPIFADLRRVNPKVQLIAEQSDWGYAQDWLERGGVDAAFAFPLRAALARLDKAAILSALAETESRTPPGKRQLHFLENHDVNRFMSEVGNDVRKARLGAALLLLLKGEPIIYYGQELGMRGRQETGIASDGAQIPLREAFRWSRSLTAPGSAVWYAGDAPWWRNRANRTGDGISLAEQARDGQSLFNLYRQLASLRAQRPEIASGDQKLACADQPQVLCLVRVDDRAGTVLIANLSDSPHRVDLAGVDPSARPVGRPWVDRLSRRRVRSRRVVLGPWSFRILGAPRNP